MFADGGGGTTSKVKFRLAGEAQPLILLPVRVNEEGPFAFILDTGAGTSLLAPELAQKLGVQSTRSRDGQTAGGKVSVAMAKVRSVSLGETALTDLEVGIVDLGHIGRAVGAQIDGDLGYNFLRDFRLTLDYRRQELRLDDPRRFDHVGAVFTEVPLRLAAPAKPLILVDSYINGRGPFPFAIDTGTSTSAISPELAAQFQLKTQPMGTVTTGGSALDLTMGTLESLQVGGARVPQVAVVIGPFLAMLSEAAQCELAGIIGYNFLRHYKVMIDYPNQRLSLLAQ
jgi:predicted aspartyl protease